MGRVVIKTAGSVSLFEPNPSALIEVKGESEAEALMSETNNDERSKYNGRETNTNHYD